MKTVWKNRQYKKNIKVDDIKIKSKVSAFFLPLHVYLPFVTLLSLLFSPFLGPKEGLKVQ